MFEFSVARKYLLPQWRQLSVSIISLISIVVISLVVWLIVLFFSVTDGLERNWVDKLVALTAPVRIAPTDAYYNSYYYQIDSISADSDYSYRSIGEKRTTGTSDPYDPNLDIEVPANWPAAERQSDGKLRDPVQLAFRAVEELSGIKGLSASDYELTAGSLKLRILRGYAREHSGVYHEYQSTMNQSAYLGSFDGRNPRLTGSLQALSMADLSNVLHLTSYSTQQALQSEPDGLDTARPELVQRRLKQFFANVDVSELITRDGAWLIPPKLLPKSGEWKALALLDGPHIQRVVVAAEASALPRLIVELTSENPNWIAGTLKLGPQHSFIPARGKPQALRTKTAILLAQDTVLSASLEPTSLRTARSEQELRFSVHGQVQGIDLEGVIPYGSLAIHAAKVLEDTNTVAPWAHKLENSASIPPGSDDGEPILLARGYRENGVFVGDRGYLSYYAPTATSVQEQRLPVYVAGFYDPGIMPMGSKFVFANQELTSQIRSAYEADDGGSGNGINVWMDNLNDAPQVKAKLEAAFKELGISQYWKVQTYQEFEFTRDLINQLHSERNVFTLIAVIIIIVACSNIISMLIILVNDKKVEIGILRSMGASARSIGAIFGACGVTMGLLGGLIGTGAAVVTLRYLQELVDFISAVQGHAAFNPMFYGDSLPNELSLRALTFVFGATLLISLLAGIVPAIKAARMRPSAILRSE